MKQNLSFNRTTVAIVAFVTLMLYSISMAQAAAPVKLPVGQGGNESCPAGTTEVAKFEWNGNAYVLDGVNIGNVQISGDAEGGSWTADPFIAAIVVKGGNDNVIETVNPAATSGTFTNANLPSVGNGRTPDISNIKFCAANEQPEPETMNISVEKVVTGDGADSRVDFPFSILLNRGDDGPPTFFDQSADDGVVQVLTDVPAGTPVDLIELVSDDDFPENWSFVDVTCESANGTTDLSLIQGPQALFTTVAGDDVTCTYTNEFEAPPPGPGTIVIAKVTTNGDTTTEFDFSGDLGDFTLTGNGSASFTVEPGTYSVEEVVPDGWQLTELNCNNGDTADAVTVGADETVKCTFVNEPEPETGTITLQKVEEGDGDPDNPNPLFTLVFTNGSNVNGGGPFFRDGNDPISYGDLPADTYTFSEPNIPEGWTLEDISCTSTEGTSTIGSFNANAGTLVVELAEGDQVDCVFTNSFTPPSEPGTIVIAKVTTDGDTTTEFDFSGDLGDFTLTGNGSASFTVEPGTYSVQEVVPDGWQLTELNCNNGDTADAVTVGADETVKCTFVNEPAPEPETGSITIRKNVDDDDFADMMFDFTFDGDEFSISENGEAYVVTDLPAGTYTILEVVPEGWDLTSISCNSPNNNTGATDGVNIVLEEGEDEDCTFNNVKLPDTYELRMIKYNDLDLDGTNNELNTGAGESPSGNALTGWEFIVYDSNGNEVGRNTTSVENAGANGDLGIRASIPGLISGEAYTICETQQEGWFNTEPGTINTTYGEPCETVTLVSSTTVTRYFGNREFAPDPGQITLGKWADDNQDGRWQRSDEDGIQGWEFTFQQLPDGEVITKTTGPNGFTSFGDLAAGDYQVCEIVPEGWVYTGFTTTQRTDDVTPVVDGDSVCFDVTIDESGERADIYFGNFELGHITLGKWADDNQDGRWQRNSEDGIQGWEFTFQQLPDGEVITQTTGPNGFTNFRNLEPGDYQVCEIVPEGWVYTGFTTTQRTDDVTPVVDGDSVCFDVTIDESGERADISFGNYEIPGKITIIKDAKPDAAWLDWTFDGDLGAFTLDNDNRSDTPDRESFTVKPGTYTVTETNLPGNWDLTGIHCGEATVEQDGTSVSITVEGGDDVTCKFVNERQPQIQIVKYNDVNESGSEDEGDSRLEGWQMFLYESDGNGGWTQIQPREVRTNEDGVTHYTNLEPGVDHLVCEEAVEDWTNSDPSDSFEYNDQICQIVSGLEYGEVRDVIFGNYEDAPTASLTIVKEIPTELEHEFVFLADFADNGQFSLTTNTDVATKTFTVTPGTYTIAEDMDSFPDEHWELVSFSCEGNALNDEDFDNFNAIGMVTVQEGESVTCTFHNERSNFEEEVDGSDGQHKIYLPFVAK